MGAAAPQTVEPAQPARRHNGLLLEA